MKFVHSLLFLILFSLSFTGMTFAQGGKITGKITDAETGEPLIGASVLIEGTTQGASTNLEGEYTILNVDPGTKTLRASYLGYSPLIVKEVIVRSSLTTEQNFALRPESFEGEEVVVTAERKAIIKDLTSTESRVSTEEIESLPVQEVDQILELQAGVTKGDDGAIHIRGGRSSEVSYVVDGIRVTDGYNQSQGLRVENESVQELQVISGTFNAEYGQAMSGIINVTTKSGSNEFKGSLRSFTGSYMTPNRDLYPALANNFGEIGQVDGADQVNFQGSLSGPIIKDKLTFFVTGRRFVNDGWLYGRNGFSPHGPLLPIIEGNERTFEQGITRVPLNNPVNKFQERVDPNLPWFTAIDTVNGDLLYTDSGVRDSSFVQLNDFETWSSQANIEYKLNKKVKFNLVGLFGREEGDVFSHQAKLVAKGRPEFVRKNYSINLKTTITPASNTFIKLNFATKRNQFEQSLFEDPFDPRFFNIERLSRLPGNLSASLQPGQAERFDRVGTDNNFIDRSTQSYIGKFEISSQVNEHHFIKAGGEVQSDVVNFQNFALQPVGANVRAPEGAELGIPLPKTSNHTLFKRKPFIAAAFIQDKIEFEKLIINVGVRLDYFDPKTRIFRNTEDPELFLPPDDRSEGFWEDVDPKVQFSPRFGVAYPYSDTGVLHFSYGLFFQIPQYSQLYEGAGAGNTSNQYVLNQTSGLFGVYANPDLEAQQTTKYEIGIQQELFEGTALSLTGYFRDIRDWVSSGPTEATSNPTVRFGTFINRDFANVFGMTLALDQTLNKRFVLGFDYTAQLAEGTNSDPAAEFFAAAARNDSTGAGITKFLVPLNWNRSHVVNTSLFFTGDTWGSSIVGKFRSGTPFTPSGNPRNVGINASEDIIINSQDKPSQFIADLRIYKNFNWGGQNLRAFLNVFNVLDSQAVNSLFTDSGDPDTPLPENIQNPEEGFLDRADFFSEPRRIQLGVEVSF